MTCLIPCSRRWPAAAIAITACCWLASGSFARTAEPAEKSAPAETPRIVAGAIQQIGSNSLSLTTEGNRIQEIPLGAESRITLNGRPATLQDLQPGDRVRVRLAPPPANVAARVRVFRPLAAEGPEPEDRPAAPPLPAVALGALVIRTPEGDVGVWRVAPRSPAAQAGLQPGDQIVEIDGHEIATPPDLMRLLAEKRAGDQIHITFLRNEKEQTATATLMRRDELLGALRQEWQERRAARREREAAREPAGEREAAEPWLGLLLGEPKDGGVAVSRVLPNSPAAQAGLEPGDLLRSLAKEKVDSPEAAQEALQRQKPGDKIPLEITRGGKEQTIEVTVASRERPREEGRRLRAERQSRPGEGERIEEMLRDLKKDVEDLRHQVQDLARKSSEAERR